MAIVWFHGVCMTANVLPADSGPRRLMDPTRATLRKGPCFAMGHKEYGGKAFGCITKLEAVNNELRFWGYCDSSQPTSASFVHALRSGKSVGPSVGFSIYQREHLPGGIEFVTDAEITEISFVPDPRDKACWVREYVPESVKKAGRELRQIGQAESSAQRESEDATPKPMASLKGRTFTGIASTEAPAVVYDSVAGEVVQEVLVASMGKFPAWTPLLDDHNRGRVVDVLGSCSRFERRGDKWYVQAQFSDGSPDDPATAAWNRVKDGHVRGLSIGYIVRDYEQAQPGQSIVVGGKTYKAGPDLPLRVTTKWEVYELSVVPIGADPAALITPMTPSAPERSYFAR